MVDISIFSGKYFKLCAFKVGVVGGVSAGARLKLTGSSFVRCHVGCVEFGDGMMNTVIVGYICFLLGLRPGSGWKNALQNDHQRLVIRNPRFK